MKGTSSALKTHMAQEVTTLAQLWKVTRPDNTVFAFTDYDQDITYLGITYIKSSGFSASNIVTSAALSVDNLEIDSFLSSDTITDADLLAKKWDYSFVQIWRVNYNDLTMLHEVLREGRMGEVSTGRNSFKAELRGLTQNLSQDIGRLFLPACNADLGDSRCTVNLASFTVTGTVTSITSQSAFTDSTRLESAQYFTAGKLTWTSGLNIGISIEVKAFLSGLITMTESMPYALAISDAYSVYAGCDKSTTVCNGTFSNIPNHRGFPLLPGTDRMISGA